MNERMHNRPLNLPKSFILTIQSKLLNLFPPKIFNLNLLIIFKQIIINE